MKLLTIICMLSLSTAQTKPLMIAHAGGGIKGQSYSNSIEALNSNYEKGFRVFELDFSWTSDNQLVCLHDWGKRFKMVFGHKTENQLSLTQFQELLETTDGLHPCTLDSLELWVKSHPDIKIVTDVKVDNIKAIKKITDEYPFLSRHFIPQFYQPEEFTILKDMGFEQLIWILYQFKGKLSSVPSYVENMDLLAISMRASQAKKKFAQELIKQGNNVYVYTINDTKKLDKLVKKYKVSGIYTDFLDSAHSESGLKYDYNKTNF